MHLLRTQLGDGATAQENAARLSNSLGVPSLSRQFAMTLVKLFAVAPQCLRLGKHADHTTIGRVVHNGECFRLRSLATASLTFIEGNRNRSLYYAIEPP